MSKDWKGDYDEEGNFTPNKNRRMREWREKKKKESDDANQRFIERYYDSLNDRLPGYNYSRNVPFSQGKDSKKSPDNRPSREPEPPQQPGLFD